jgi:predicted DCC family thiol-disulfide oxidoreductase YuxK
MAAQKLQSPGPHLILYDGVCGLCNRLNAFVLKHDRKAHFRFASLQSARGQSFLRQFNRDPDDLNTFYVIANYESGPVVLLDRARAGVFVLKTFAVPWRWTGIFGILPNSLLNFGYDCLARNRYRIFGKFEQCMMPNVEHRERFIDV